ncbi:uncharacterized protein LOC122860959 [Aphidius gifuensis]|uniref:uncharacterized protein LOC122860959 n=1 Tax=Aphidius gifuensis TaxID=684658 RepID=UPI001CDBA4CB|nr:uncharacterized protein LOC122860959 [Aphidius gifuensis]
MISALLLLVLLPVSITPAPMHNNPTMEKRINNTPSNESNNIKYNRYDNRLKRDNNRLSSIQKNQKNAKKNRIHKSFIMNYPYISEINNPLIVDNKNYQIQEKSISQHKDSEIFYIRLPPTPYIFVPGLGYISNPPKYSTNSIQSHVNYQQQINRPIYQQQFDQFIHLPIDFISNGKPTSVYQWNNPVGDDNNRKKPDNQIIKLNKGPYNFNGQPISFYLLGPDGQATVHQRIISYQQNTIY